MPTGLFMGCTCAREVDLLTADMPEKQLAALNSVPQLASRYLKQIRTLQPEGPYFLAGESFRGLVAFEMAQQLRAQGETVSLLALFDSPVPGDRKQLPLAERLSLHLQNLSREGLSYALNKGWRRISLSLDKLLRITSRIYGKFNSGRRRNGGAGLSIYLAGRQRVRANPPLRLQEGTQRDIRQMVLHQAFTNYAPQPYQDKMGLFRAMERNEFDTYYADPELGWGLFAAGGLEVHDVPGDHIGILKDPNVQVIAAKLIACLERAEMAANFRG
jgi:thioesterase domain-containing protein